MDSLEQTFRIFLCGDVMTGRGIDQILSHPSKPQLYESFVTDARDYVLLAEKVNGKIHYPVDMNYIWGDALTVWKQFAPNVKIINLETAISTSDHCWPNKGINYRMHPLNIGVLKAANINIVTLANNHILDWSDEGLRETLSTLKSAGISYSGAGENISKAIRPAIFKLDSNKRVLLFAACMDSSGVPSNWKADSKLAGVYYLQGLTHDELIFVAENIKKYKNPGDLIIFSIHWGSNWGYEVAQSFRSFAHGLIDLAKVDVVFGHSSHHPRPIEIYHDKPILYGCGDFINDYEGISGYEDFRGDLSLMYFLDFDSSLHFKKMTLIPLQIKKFSLHLANEKDCKWLLQVLNQSATFSAQFKLQDKSLIYDISIAHA